MRKPKLVILDLDATLLLLPVDWKKATKEVLAYGKRVHAEFDPSQYIIPLSSVISSTPARKKAVDAIWRKHELASIRKYGIRRYPKAEAFVKFLHARRIRLAVASNNTHAAAAKSLRLAGILHCINLIICRDDILHTKPAPDMLLKILKELKVRKPDAVFIGNSKRSDVPAGKAAGIRTILIKPGGSFPKFHG